MIVNLVIALPAEAAPLIQYFELQRVVGRNSIPIYQNSESGIGLAVCGVGTERVAAGVHELLAVAQDQPSPQGWLNIGIAGHGRAPVGRCLLAHRISNGAGGACVYPHILPDQEGIARTHLVTVAVPEQEYREDAAYDMEGFGFFSTALQCSTVELIRVVKIVSDNPENGTEHIDRAMVESLVRENIESIDTLITQLQEQVRQFHEIYAAPAEFATLQSRVRLSVTQRLQLQQLCRRLLARGRGDALGSVCAMHFDDGRSLLEALASLARE